CLDHTAEDFAEQLAATCDKGIDVYFENVGGKVFDAVLPLLNVGARVPLCGLISQYNATSLPEGPDRMSLLMGNILVKRIKMQGFIIFDHYEQNYSNFVKDVSHWVAEGKIHYREHLVQGLENAPEAFIGLLEG
ncbi:zinc-binding dehydrogenase, partial [Vibrio astriarenae]